MGRAAGWRRRLALAGGALLTCLVLVGALEGGLRLLGVGDPPPGGSRLRYQQLDLPILRPGRRPDGTPVLRTVDPRLPYQAVPREKAPGTLRVFVFGGSAAAGLGYSPNVTFARYLEEMLAEAGRTVEVVNLGIVALSSRQVLALVDDVCRHGEPDLLVVYSGNNEFLELHAAKYQAAHAGPLERLRARLADTNLYRALLRLAGRGRPLSVSRDPEADGLRLSEAELIEDVEVAPAEVDAVVDAYEENVAGMAARARGAGVPLVLMAVASNWRWRGREDLPEGWLAEWGGPEDAPARLDAALAGAGDRERAELLFQRAALHELAGRHDAARADYRAAMNADPHLRRALDVMNERVEAVASRGGASYLDTVTALAAEAEHGIVGFGELYDYVHLTPRGALLVAAALCEHLREAGLAEVAEAPRTFVERRLEEIGALEVDALDARRWVGFCFDRGGLADRDLWKYDRAVEALDERLARDPDDVRARVYRGNARAFRVDGAAGAAADWRAALALLPEDAPEGAAVRANLEALQTER